MSATAIYHDAFHLKAAFHCMRAAHPLCWREALIACRESRAERRRILRDFRSHFWFGAICVIHGIKP